MSEIYVCVTINIAEKYRDCINTYRFSRYGEKVKPSEQIHTLNIDNMLEEKEMCKQWSNIDTNFGKMEAQNFISFNWNSPNKLIGYYENGVLVGVASYIFSAEADIALLDNVYIVPELRNKRLVLKLVKSTISMYPEKTWLYQAGVKNEASINLAFANVR